MSSTPYLERHALAAVVDALHDTRVVLLEGPRQAGKSTLAARVAERRPGGMRLLTLDDDVVRGAAVGDPVGFIAGLGGPTVIDEIQRAPGLVLAIKAAVDRDPAPGRFLLTGSASLRSLGTVADLLPGRMETIRLWPLSQAEIEGNRTNFVEALFAGTPPHVDAAPVGRAAFVERLVAGGYPEARTRTASRRVPWFRDYVDGVFAHDIPGIASLQKVGELPRLLRLLSAQSGGILDYRKVSRDLKLGDKTVKSYITVLEQLFIVHRLRAWRPGIGKRELHAPKLHVVDSGLLSFLMEADASRVATDDQITGRALESFCAMEVLRLADRAPDPPTAFHYRDGRDEIDLVLESRGGYVVAIEVKASATVKLGDARTIARLRDARSDTFKAGIVLYAGAATVPLGDRIWAVPISGLWDAGRA